MIKSDFLSLEDVFDEVAGYLAANADIVRKATGTDLALDLPSYRAAAESGQMMILTLRHDGRLVGFSLFHVAADLRDKTRFEATNHGIVVSREYRKKYGERMFSEAHKFLKRAGVSETMYINDNAAFGRFLKKFHAKPKFTIWSVQNGQ